MGLLVPKPPFGQLSTESQRCLASFLYKMHRARTVGKYHKLIILIASISLLIGFICLYSMSTPINNGDKAPDIQIEKNKP